jgi:hypothetical protein
VEPVYVGRRRALQLTVCARHLALGNRLFLDLEIGAYTHMRVLHGLMAQRRAITDTSVLDEGSIFTFRNPLIFGIWPCLDRPKRGPTVCLSYR